MGRTSAFASVDEYLAATAAPVRPALEKIRAIVKSVAPQAQETISYGMPAFRQGRIFIYFAAFRKHVGIYPPVRGGVALDKALQPYRGPKGNLKFPLDRAMPYGLIRRVAIALVKQHGSQR